MKRILQALIILAAGLLIGAASAQTKPTAKPPVAVKAPAIPDAVLAKFWKAQTQVQQADAATKQAQGQFQAVVKEMEAACGAEYQPAMNQAGDPACAPKSKEPKK